MNLLNQKKILKFNLLQIYLREWYRNFDISIPMTYASYDGSLNNPRLKEFINKYIELGGSKYVYWLPNYFSKDIKNRFVMEELGDVINYIQYDLSKDKKSYYKKLH